MLWSHNWVCAGEAAYLMCLLFNLFLFHHNETLLPLSIYHTAYYKPTPSRACDLSCWQHGLFSLCPLLSLLPLCLEIFCWPCLCCLLCFFGVSVCASTGEVDRKKSEKTVRVEPNKSASADDQATADGQEAVKVTHLKAVKSRTVRSKRRVKGEGKPAHSSSCLGIYSSLLLAIWCLSLCVCLWVHWLLCCCLFLVFFKDVIQYYLRQACIQQNKAKTKKC